MNKTFSTTIDEDGVLLIPEEVLDAYGWEEGTELSLKVLENGDLEIKKHDPLTETNDE
jgi:bifunctional DNA-binding transcriptional regulator/antitoxin component of YhaV-PrlF toxin-antitoxin module